MNFLVTLQIFLLFPLLLCCCDATKHPFKDTVQKKEILVYCGTTMLQPIVELSEIVEKDKNCVVKVSYGGSRYLANSVEVNRIGELFFPGSVSYVLELQKKGLISETIDVGYNEIALFVRRGNPKNVKADLTELMRPDLKVVIGADNAGSIGKATQICLSKKGLYEDISRKALFLTTDSNGLVRALLEEKADVVLNWRAVGYLDDNKNNMDELRLPEDQVLQQKLTIGLLNSSQNKELGRYFLALTVSNKGKEIFQRYGF